MKNHYGVRSDDCVSQKQSSENAKDRKVRMLMTGRGQLCPAGRSGRPLGCGRPGEEEQGG